LVANWVLEIASRRNDAEFELVDLRDYPLPHLDELLPPSLGQSANDHTKEWSAKIASFDGFVCVTLEYNHGTSGVLKNAIDYLYAEWNNKAVGFVSHGAVGGASMSAWMNGRSTPSLVKAIDIAELFQVSTDRLMGAEFVDLLQTELADPERFKRVEARIRRASTPLKAV
jgi:NAD(P)H-dependent FMN reductase